MSSPQPNPFRWTLIKQVVILQFKLGMDTLRDILLSPVSLILAGLDLLLGNDRQSSYFFKMLHYGRLSDHWINLFGDSSQPQQQEDKVDYWLAKAEALIIEQKNSGKFSEAAKAKLEQYLAKIAGEKVDEPSRKSQSNDNAGE